MAAALGAWLLFNSGTSVAEAPNAVQERDTTGVAGFAEMYVAKYLNGDADQIGEFLPAPPPLAAMTPAAHYAARIAAIEIAEVEPGYWAVLVVADVLEREDAGYVSAGLQHFKVGVVDDGGRLVAAGLPSRVAAPASRRAKPRSLATAEATPDDAVAAVVGDFLEALLLGDRDLARYATTDSRISAVAFPYAILAITSVSGYADGSVRAVVEAGGLAGPAVTMEYFLRIDHTSGGPLVAEVLPGPPSIHEPGATS
jgi:hypothetical protein